MTLQAAPDLAVTLSFSAAPKPVRHALGVEIHPPDDDGVEGSVELTITASLKSVADDLTGRSGDRCHAAKGRAGGVRGQKSEPALPRCIDRRSCPDDRTPRAPPDHPWQCLPQSQAPHPREPAPTPAASSRPPVPAPAPPSHPRQALLAARPPPLQELATPSPPGPARDCAALASPGLAPVLALAVASSARAAMTEARGPVSDRHHGARKPPLGHRADPRRAAQARHRRECPLHPPLPTSWASPAAQPELAHLPRQPCPGHLGS